MTQFYKLKDDSIKKWVYNYELHKEVCSLMEYLVYFIGIPPASFKNYFEKNNIPFDDNFIIDMNLQEDISTKMTISIIKNFNKNII